MKKLVFVVVLVFGVGVFFGSVWTLTKVNPQGRPMNPAITSKNRNPPSNQGPRMRSNSMPNIRATSRNIPNSPRPLQRSNSEPNISDFRQQPPNILDVRLPGDTVRQVLADIAKSFPANNLQELSRQINSFLNQPLDSDENARKARSILEKAQNCFGRIAPIWSTLYRQVFGEFPNVGQLSNTVALKEVQTKLDLLKLDKLQEIISIYDQYGKRKQDFQTKADLENFLNYIAESKAILSEMNDKLTRKVLNQIEGLPKLPNLEKTNTLQNQELKGQSDSYNLSNQMTNINVSAYSEGVNIPTSHENNQITNDELLRALSVTRELTEQLLNIIRSSGLSKKLDNLSSLFQRLRINT